jgi:hypothetical protein
MTAVSLVRISAMLAERCVSVVPNRRESRHQVTFGVRVERVLNWREGRRLGGVESKTLGNQAEASGEDPRLLNSCWCPVIHHRSCASILVFSRNLGCIVCLFRLIPLHREVYVNLTIASVLDMIPRACQHIHTLGWVCCSPFHFLGPLEIIGTSSPSTH